MLVPNRHASSAAYRYGFQGQEKDDELKGEGNSLNYTFRMHDPRVGRFFAVDPLTSSYPWYTPYSFSGNKVIAFTELEGLEESSAITNKDWTWRFYSVQVGDNLSIISEVTGVSVYNILKYNPSIENPDLIHPKQFLDLNGGLGLPDGSFVFDEKKSKFAQLSYHLTTDDETGPSLQSLFFAATDPLGTVAESIMGKDIPDELHYAITAYRLLKGKGKKTKTKTRSKMCFVKGTKVLIEKGEKNIEEIQVGDLVWSYNQITNKVELKKVVSLSSNISSTVIEIISGGIKIECTPEHPFYIAGEWKIAGDLNLNDKLTLIDGKEIAITFIDKKERKEKVYNFEVKGNHNYYITKLGFLTHNDCDYVKKQFSPNVNSETDNFGRILKKMGNSIQNLTKNPGLAKMKIPGLDVSTLGSWNKKDLSSHLGGLMSEGLLSKKQVNKFMTSFNKAFQNRTSGGNLGKKK